MKTSNRRNSETGITLPEALFILVIAGIIAIIFISNFGKTEAEASHDPYMDAKELTDIYVQSYNNQVESVDQVNWRHVAENGKNHHGVREAQGWSDSRIANAVDHMRLWQGIPRASHSRSMEAQYTESSSQ